MRKRLTRRARIIKHRVRLIRIEGRKLSALADSPEVTLALWQEDFSRSCREIERILDGERDHEMKAKANVRGRPFARKDRHDAELTSGDSGTARVGVREP